MEHSPSTPKVFMGSAVLESGYEHVFFSANEETLRTYWEDERTEYLKEKYDYESWKESLKELGAVEYPDGRGYTRGVFEKVTPEIAALVRSLLPDLYDKELDLEVPLYWESHPF